VHVANAQRVCNDLHAMEAALTRALKLWEEGEPGDPGLLNRAVVPWIEAACRRAQRRFPEALKRIEDALALDGGELRGKILLSKSSAASRGRLWGEPRTPRASAPAPRSRGARPPLARRTPAERRLIVEEGEEYQTAALWDRVAAESALLAETNPRAAQELAALAERIGELVSHHALTFRL